MLQSNGRIPKEKRNYHMSLCELAKLMRFVRQHYDPKFLIMIATQFSLGLRASEMLAIQIWDFSSDFKYLNYRQAKSNKMIYNEPVPEILRRLIIPYIMQNRHRLKDGYLFPCYTGRGNHICVETYGTYWSKWRNQLGKKHAPFLDKYEITTSSGKKQIRYRISSHSLRRLHRTELVKEYPNKLFDVMVVCNYSDFSSFKRYINEYKTYQNKEAMLRPVLDTALERALLYSSGQKQLSTF